MCNSTLTPCAPPENNTHQQASGGVVDDAAAKAARRAAVLKDKLLGVKARAQPTLDEDDGFKNPITTPSSLKPQPQNIRLEENKQAI